MVNQDVLIAEYNTLRAELIQTIQMNVPGLLIPISILCGKIKERKICSYTMWKGMNIKHGTSNHTSGLPSVGG